MLDGIEMNIIDMTHKVFFVADSVFPKSLLPDTAFSVIAPGLRDLDFFTTMSQPCFGEPALYAAPSFREIAIVFGQFSDTMQVVWQQDNSRQIKWIFCLLFSNRLTQTFTSS